MLATHLAPSPSFSSAAAAVPPAASVSRGRHNRRQQFVFTFTLTLTLTLTLVRFPSKLRMFLSSTTTCGRGGRSTAGQPRGVHNSRGCFFRLQHRKFLGFNSSARYTTTGAVTAIATKVGSCITIATACRSPLAGASARLSLLLRPARSGPRSLGGAFVGYAHVVQEVAVFCGVDAPPPEPEAAGRGGEVVAEGAVAPAAVAVQQEVPARLRRQRGIAHRLGGVGGDGRTGGTREGRGTPGATQKGGGENSIHGHNAKNDYLFE